MSQSDVPFMSLSIPPFSNGIHHSHEIHLKQKNQEKGKRKI